MSNSNYPPSFPVAKLYRRKSEKGTTYFVGYWGGARVTVLKSKQTTEDGTEIWSLLLSEAPKRDDAGQRLQSAPARDWQRPEAEPNQYAAAKGSGRANHGFDEEIPF
ncbi:MAG TPA: hypothetical protein VNK52_14280 [Hyphomicrobiaceae bacterium]|nr:hypothetical protein [Hyphomicrobiaceae bacterium]